jgi:precorrin-3B methylase
VVPQRRGGLLVVGVGIRGLGQSTLEAAEAIKQADRVFYVIPEPTTAHWVRQLNPSARSLATLYAVGKDRSTTYREMTDTILAAVIEGHRVCAVFYGHPGVFVEASHDAIRRARRKGYPAYMLPGVSADACLFADIGLNPGQHGVQSFEATDFLVSRRRFDPASNLLLWQVGGIGLVDWKPRGTESQEPLDILAAMLARHYGPRHTVVVYHSATFPAHASQVKRVRLDRLSRVKVHANALLFVPPTAQRAPSARIRARLSDR